MSEQKKVLLHCEHLVKEYVLDRKRSVHAVSDISLDIYEGECLALVGESGCGKSTLGRTLIQLYQPTSGKVFFKDKEISNMKPAEFAPYRRQMQMIFQDPYASLDPRMDVFHIIAEPLVTYKVCKDKEELKEKVLELMDAVGVPGEFLYRYPHQFSGGQRQRIGIARAIALQPSLVICDEPVSALDVSIQSQVLNLLKDIQEQYGLTYLFISHDLSVVRFISNRVCVMFLGKVCEIGDSELIYQNPLHPYTKFLMDAIPIADPRCRDVEKPLLTGEIPSPINPPKGCRFHTRCPYATDRCRQEEPGLREVEGRMVACHQVGSGEN
ncbi:MAG: ATP-binding cassette domain-containing protein [Clostridia bacterium]|nr:ATP-binding cassette domain-containing protein [Clostridia bacterium]MDY5555496.1 oligopeptide/dipeptide ABC transporter ATP-binding protein [Blautia sp.]